MAYTARFQLNRRDFTKTPKLDCSQTHTHTPTNAQQPIHINKGTPTKTHQQTHTIKDTLAKTHQQTHTSQCTPTNTHQPTHISQHTPANTHQQTHTNKDTPTKTHQKIHTNKHTPANTHNKYTLPANGQQPTQEGRQRPLALAEPPAAGLPCGHGVGVPGVHNQQEKDAVPCEGPWPVLRQDGE